VVNGLFDDGLNGWSSVGSIFTTGAQGVLTDQTTARTLLWQMVMLPPGTYIFGFDVLPGGLAGVGGPGTLPDTFFATLFLDPDPLTFDPIQPIGFTTALAVADLDLSGITALAATATTGPSAKGLPYLRITMPIQVVKGVVAVFELSDLNFASSDSVVAVDNVTIELIPEPTVPFLCLPVALFMLRRRRG
jgi:hypothetical protein